MVKEYVINSLAAFEVLDRMLMAEHEVKSRQAGSSEEREEIAIKFTKFTIETNNSFNKYIQNLSRAYDIVRLENLYSTVPSGLSKISSIPLKIRTLTLNIHYYQKDILSCLENLAKFSALEELTLDTTNFDKDCFESDKMPFTSVLDAMRLLVQENKQLRAFKIIDEGFKDKIKDGMHAVYWKEIQGILSTRECSIERLETMKKDLDETRALLEANVKFYDEHPQNDKSKETCEALEQECKELEQQLLEAVESAIASRDHADIGSYFKAGLIQLKEPVEAYRLLSQIPESSACYLKANNLSAHILMDDTVFSQVFYPQFEEGIELEGDEAEKFIIEKLKKIIHHLRLAKVEGDEKRLFGKLLTELVYGEDSLAEKTPFDNMPLEAEAAVDFLLDMLREQHNKIKVLEAELQGKGPSTRAQEEALRQNVLRFYPPLQQQQKDTRNNEDSKLRNSQ